MIISKWHHVLKDEKHKPYFINILKKIENERASGITIYPKKNDIFNAFRFTELDKVRVVILGQDPYCNFGQAHGLAFSVRPGFSIPPSLCNIYKELEKSIPNFLRPNHGYLESWAKQGILLLNTILTVRSNQARSHAKLGWEVFTNTVISIINQYREGVIFLLWGSCAKKKRFLLIKNVIMY